MRKLLLGLVLLALSVAVPADGLFDIVTKGSTSRSVTVDIIDSTDGTPETGVVFNTAGIDLWYRREGAAVTSITEVTLAALTTAYSSGGFLAVSHGKYRLDLPDAAFATGANYVDFGGTVTGMIVIGGRVRLIDTSLEVANLTANVTQFGGTNGTFASGRPEVNTTHINGTAVAAGSCTGAIAVLGIVDCGTAQAVTATTLQLRTAANFDADSEIIGATCVVTSATTGAGQSRTVTAYTNATDTATVATWTTTPTGTITYACFGTSSSSSSVSVATGGITAASFASGAIDATAIATDAIGAPEIAADAIGASELATDAIGAPEVAASAIGNAELTASGTNLTNIPWNASWDAEVQSEANDALTTNFLDQLLLNTYNPASPPGAADSFLEDLVENNAGVTRFTVAALANGPSGGGGANINTIESVDATDQIDARIAAAALATAANLATLTTTVGAAGAGLTAADDAVMTRLGAPAGASVSADIQAVEDQTDDIGVAGAGLTAADDAVMARLGAPAGASVSADIDALPTNAELSTALTSQLTTQRIVTGTCSGGSTTTCVDAALTQAAASQLQDRLMCFDDSWCGMITTFNPGTDTTTTTKVAPTTRSGRAYTIFPSTLE